MWCRRQWYGLGTVFGPPRGGVRLYQECTWLASIRVVVARVRRAITHGRCSRGGWAGVWGARRRRRLSRGGSDVWCECFNDRGGGGGYNDSFPGDDTKTTPSGDTTT